MSPRPITENTLFYGDNLDILRQYIPDESIDLIYLDPPFNSSRSYNVLFKDESGIESEAQITAFEDTWHWNQTTEDTYRYLTTQTPDHISRMIEALRTFIGRNQMTAYLVMMAVRLIELHRVLKLTGSLYLHCDPTASHYLKVILDTIFGVTNYKGEIIWKRTTAHNDPKRPGRIHDVLLFYTKTNEYTWNKVFKPYSNDYIESHYGSIDAQGRRYTLDNLTAPSHGSNAGIYEWHGQLPPQGRMWSLTREKMDTLYEEGRIHFTRTGMPRYIRYLDEMQGVPMQDVWDDIPPVNSMAQERLGYPTQKPLALLDRIIQASSNPDSVILDPFCGCGSAIASAQKLGRKWIGIDLTHLAIALQKYRLEAMFPGIKFKVVGEPADIGAARQLAKEDRYQFQFWATSLIRAKPLGSQEGSRDGKKGSDKGIDGVIAFIDDTSGKAKRVLVQVKSGHVKSGDIRDLVGTVQREQAAIGVFITLEEPSRDMKTEAISAGYYHSPGWNIDYPRIQIFSIAELLRGEAVKMPPQFGTFKQAQRVQQSDAGQPELGLA